MLQGASNHLSSANSECGYVRTTQNIQSKRNLTHSKNKKANTYIHGQSPIIPTFSGKYFIRYGKKYYTFTTPQKEKNKEYSYSFNMDIINYVKHKLKEIKTTQERMSADLRVCGHVWHRVYFTQVVQKKRDLHSIIIAAFASYFNMDTRQFIYEAMMHGGFNPTE